MKKWLLFFMLVISFPIFAKEIGVDDAMNISLTGVLAQKTQLKLTAENIANATTLKTKSGKPYAKKYAIIEATPFGVKVISVAESKAPFKRVYDPGNPMADRAGFITLPNVDLAEEMTQLSITNLLYEANATAYKSAKTMYQQTMELMK